MSSWGFGFPKDWLGDASIAVAKALGDSEAARQQRQARISYAEDLLASREQGTQLRAQPHRALQIPPEYLNRALTRTAEVLLGAAYDSDSLPVRETSENLRSGLDALAGFLSPSGSPATVAGRIPVKHLDDVLTKVYERLTTKAFRPGTSPTYEMRGNTLFTRVRHDADVDEAQKYAIERLMADVSGEVPDEIIAGGPKEISKHLYNRSYREGLVKLRKDQELRKEVDYEGTIDEFMDEGSKGSALENVPAEGMRGDFKAAEELAESYSPMAGDVTAGVAATEARTAAEAAASNQMSQILSRILNPRQRYILTQLDTPNAQLARELYKVPEGTKKLPEWMYKQINTDKRLAQLVARGANAPGLVKQLGVQGASQQWIVVKNALRDLKPTDLNARLGALPERVRPAAQEFATRAVAVKDLIRKYKKSGLTREELYDAVQKLTHPLPE